MTTAMSLLYDDERTYLEAVKTRCGETERARLEANPQLDTYDFGVWWRDAKGYLYRLSWQDDTDELYLTRLSGPHYTIATEFVTASAGKASGAVEVLAVIPAYEEANHDPAMRPNRDDTVEKILKGWAEVCERKDSVSWIRVRVAWAVELGLARYP